MSLLPYYPLAMIMIKNVGEFPQFVDSHTVKLACPEDQAMLHFTSLAKEQDSKGASAEQYHMPNSLIIRYIKGTATGHSGEAPWYESAWHSGSRRPDGEAPISTAL